jgi:hypothetical protein
MRVRQPADEFLSFHQDFPFDPVVRSGRTRSTRRSLSRRTGQDEWAAGALRSKYLGSMRSPNIIASCRDLEPLFVRSSRHTSTSVPQYHCVMQKTQKPCGTVALMRGFRIFDHTEKVGEAAQNRRSKYRLRPSPEAADPFLSLDQSSS